MKFDVKLVLSAGIILLLGSQASGQGATELAETQLDTIYFHQSGWFRRDTTQIIYRQNDDTIVSIRDRGRSIPASEFHQYEHQLMEYRYLTQIQKYKPQVEELTEQLNRKRLPPEEILSRTEDLLNEVRREQMILRDALGGNPYMVQLIHLQTLGLRVAIGMLLKKNGYDTQAEGFEIQLEFDRVFINGEKLPPGEAYEYLESFHHYIRERSRRVTVRFDSEDFDS